METDLKVADALVVTVHFAPSPWLTDRDVIDNFRVGCIVSKTNSTRKVDLARPLHALPDEMFSAIPWRRNNLRRAFRVALRTAVEAHLSEQISPIPDSRVEWEAVL